jgi:hypothetical protein
MLLIKGFVKMLRGLVLCKQDFAPSRPQRSNSMGWQPRRGPKIPPHPLFSTQPFNEFALQEPKTALN